jgi:hypothetical protein
MRRLLITCHDRLKWGESGHRFNWPRGHSRVDSSRRALQPPVDFSPQQFEVYRLGQQAHRAAFQHLALGLRAL